MKHAAFAAILALSSALIAPAAASSFAIDGDARSMTLLAEQASRSEIVAAIVERFDLVEEGSGVEDGVVDGRFTGSLSEVLKSILPAKGYAIAYRDGKPSRLTFAGTSRGQAATGSPGTAHAAPGHRPAVAGSPPASQAIAAPTVGELLQRRTFEQMVATKPAAPPAPQPTGKSMQQEIAEATARAVAELRAITGGLRGANQAQSE